MPFRRSFLTQFEPGCEDLRDAIDSVPIGDDDWDWEEPGWPTDGENKHPRPEAAANIIGGNERVVRFACRGAGTPGLPAVSAPLADPKAVINDDAVPVVDLLLRRVASTLLEGDESESSLDVEAVFADTDMETRIAIADCLCYLRARVGVPRDMSYPAANELRRTLGQVSRALRTETSAPVEAIAG